MPSIGNSFVVSLVAIPDTLIEEVAREVGVDASQVRDYLLDEKHQNASIFKAFARHRIFPVGKFPGEDSDA